MPVLRDERERRGDLPREERAELAGRVCDVTVVRAQYLRRVLDLEEHRSADDLVHGMEVELEVRDDAEIPAATPQGPEQVRVGLLARGDERPVRKDDIRGP